MYLRREHWHLQQRQTSIVTPSHVNIKPSQVNLNIANFQSPVSHIKNDILAQIMICNHIPIYNTRIYSYQVIRSFIPKCYDLQHLSKLSTCICDIKHGEFLDLRDINIRCHILKISYPYLHADTKLIHS